MDSDSITAICSAFVACFTAWIGFQMVKWKHVHEEAAKQAAIKVEQVAIENRASNIAMEENTVAVSRKLDGIAETTEKVQKATNSGLLAYQSLAAFALKRVADYSKGEEGHEDDKLAANMAMEVFMQHQKYQDAVDQKAYEDSKKSDLDTLNEMKDNIGNT